MFSGSPHNPFSILYDFPRYDFNSSGEFLDIVFIL